MELTPAARLLQMITGFALARAVYAAAKLGIADRLKDGPRAVDELAKSAGADAGALRRLLRFLSSHGIFAERDDGRFELTPLAECLQSGAPGALRAWAIFWGEEWIWRPWGELLHSVKTGRPAFAHLYGVDPFEFLTRNPPAAAIYRDAMNTQAEWEAAAVAAAYDFSAAKKIVDVGGSDAALLRAVLKERPGARGILFDRPHAIERAGAADGCELVAGDFFAAVPAGADVYILKHVLHNWDDERAVAILENCRAAMSGDGKVLVIESLLLPGNRPDPAKFLDLHMLVRQSGRERTESEYRALLGAAGFRATRIVPTRAQVGIVEGTPA